MFKQIATFTFLILLLSCERKSVTENVYPEEIIQNNLQEKYDIAKWELYKKLVNCKGYKYIDKDQKVSNMISCDLRFKRIEKKHDSIELVFLPYCDTSDNPYFSLNCELYSAVGFVGQSDKIRYWKGPPFTSIEIDYEYYIKLPDSMKTLPNKYVNDTLKNLDNIHIKIEEKFREYLRKNKDNLNPWLLKKAKQKGVFN